MSFISFLRLVEIQTKVASMIPFLMGTLYAVYRFQQFHLKNFMLLFISLLTFDMSVTVMNNYYDYKKAQKRHGYGYESHNAIVKYKLKENAVIGIIVLLLLIAVGAGFILFLNTNITLIVLGALSFMVGILYSFGPIPISRMPLGEIFSGLFMGFVILFISVYIHVYDQLISVSYHMGVVDLQINIMEIVYIFLISIPAICGIANIMLVNNICDMEEDLENKRYTLPIYIGKKRALQLFKFLYYIAYIDIIALLWLTINPLLLIFLLGTLIPVRNNISVFLNIQSKKHTFVLAVKNFMIMNVSRMIILGIGILLHFFN